MTYQCVYDNLTETFECVLPDSFNVLTEKSDLLETVNSDVGTFSVDKTITYGDLTISFFLFLFLLIYIFKIITKFFLGETVRIKKYEL